MPTTKLSDLPKPKAEFDQYSETYVSQINESLAFSGASHDFFTKTKADYLTKILANKDLFNGNTIHALDVGCGHGLIHPYLLEKNTQLSLSGVDVASDTINIARSTNPDVSYKTYDGMFLPYDEHVFDMAFAICVMHHVPPVQWGNFLQEMRRVVKPGGVVVIFEHNPANPVTRRVVKNCPLDKDAVLLRSKSMKHLMKQAGLKVIKNTFILFTPFDKPVFHKLDCKLGWLPLGAQYFTLSINQA